MVAAIDLDDPQSYRSLDPSDMLGHIDGIPAECRTAYERGLAFSLPREYARVDRVVVLGMGGSAIGGDLLAGLLGPEVGVPISVVRDYDVPPWIDERTLVVASSYSGNTEETLSAFTQALQSPARKVALTTGGKLAALARENGVPLFTIEYRGAPRAALPHSLFSLVGVFQGLGLVGDRSAEVAEMVAVLERLATECGRDIGVPANLAKQLAQRLHGRLPVVYAAGLLSDVARRWKTQINENSKAWAFFEVLPELDHNAVVGYEFPGWMKERALVLFLRSPLLHPRVLLRYQITSEILARAGVEHEVVEGRGEGRCAQLMSLVLVGDYLSYYLALLNGTDPSPVAVIDYLKGRLA